MLESVPEMVSALGPVSGMVKTRGSGADGVPGAAFEGGCCEPRGNNT